MNESFSFRAPAKINLSLKILHKRDDGFHELDMLMVKLPDLADNLVFSPSNTWSLSCSDSSVPVDESNLVTKAKLAFDRVSGMNSTYAVELKKEIPHGAGLAGGSSDAATTLHALNKFSGAPLSLSQLHGIAAGLGSDIPFFLYDHPMWCRGRGELLQKAEGIPKFRLLLLKPSFGVSTPAAYKQWKDSKRVPSFSYDEQVVDGVNFVNDLERPVFQKHLFLGEVKNWLLKQAGVRASMMSGSGSTVFAVIEDSVDEVELITAAKRQLDPTLWSWSGTS